MTRHLVYLWIIAVSCLNFAAPANAQDEEGEGPELNSALLSALEFRNIGPALMSGRIVDIAVDPSHHSTWYVAVASAFGELHDELRQLIEGDLVALEDRLEAAGAPWTPGRKLPRWEPR